MNKYITLDEALLQVGNDGRYQIFIFICFGIQFVSSVFLGLSPTYLYVQPPLICSLNDEIVQNYTCQNDESCDLYKITFDPSYQHTTFVNEFDLICNRDYLIPIAQSSMFLGGIIGCLFFSYLGDIKGRRIALLLAWGTTTFGIVAVCFTFNMIWFIFFNFIAGLGVNGAYNLCFVMLNETSGNLFRQKASMGLQIFWGAGEIACAFLYYLINNWRYVWICFAALPAIIAFIMVFYIYETPKYYLSQQQYEKAYDALDQIAKVNKTPKFDRTQTLVLQLESDEKSIQQKLVKISQNQKSEPLLKKNQIYEHNYYSLLKYKSLKTNTICFVGFLFSLQVIYIGGQYSLNKISTSGNAVYLLGGCLGLSEIISYIFIERIIEKIKRKITVIISQIASILFMSCFLIFGFKYDSIDLSSDCNFCSKEIIILLLTCLIRISCSICFCIQPLYCTESYPTVIRTIGLGFVFSLGLIGAFLAPYTFYLAQILGMNTYIIIIILSLFGPIMSTMLKETHGLPLKDQIEEEENLLNNMDD